MMNIMINGFSISLRCTPLLFYKSRPVIQYEWANMGPQWYLSLSYLFYFFLRHCVSELLHG